MPMLHALTQQLCLPNIKAIPSVTEYGVPYHALTSSTTDYRKKPIAVILSHEENYFEHATLFNLLNHLPDLLGYQPDVRILCGHNKTRDLEYLCLHHIVEHQDYYAACVTLSNWTTYGALERLPMGGHRLPLVFANVHDPHSLGIVNQFGRNSRVAGVVHDPQHYVQQLKSIKDIMPNFNRLLVPHDITKRNGILGNLNHGSINKLLKHGDFLGIEVKPIGITPQMDIVTEVMDHYKPGSVFVVTRESSVLVQSPRLLQACSRIGMPVFADTLLPAQPGSAFGTGNSGALAALPLAHILKQIIVDGKMPGDVPFAHVKENQTLFVNQEVFENQGITVDDKTRRLIDVQNITTVWKEEL